MAAADAPMQYGDEGLEEDAMDEETELQRFLAEQRTSLLSCFRNAHPGTAQADVEQMVNAALAEFSPTR